MSYTGRKVQALRVLVWQTYPPACCHCSKPLTFDTMTVEHLLPRSRGGSEAIENLRPACGPCNFGRGNRPMRRKNAENHADFFSATG